MAFHVKISAQAERDAEGILEWLLSEHAGETGLRWFLALDDAIASLAMFPQRCPLAPENLQFPFEVRQLSLRSETAFVSDSVYCQGRECEHPSHSAWSARADCQAMIRGAVARANTNER